ncbi:MAG: J domain-containing protein [Acidimicrobiales bacterium]
MTHYEVLGVPPTASTAEIRRAYVRLARRHHPDYHATADASTRAAAEREMRRINEAWAVLSDDRRRRDYDRLQQGLRSSGPGVAPRHRPRPTGGPSPDFRPYDPSDEVDPRDLLDDTPVHGAASVPRWVQVAPVGLLVVSLASLAVSLVTSIRPLLALGVLTFALSGVAFLLAPMFAVMRSAQSERD